MLYSKLPTDRHAPPAATAAHPEPTTVRSPRQSLLERAGTGPGAGDPVAIERFERLLEIVDSLGSCVLALSGGIDSSFLLAVASPLLGERCLALTADSAAVPAWDRADAVVAAGEASRHGARWRTVPTKELEDPRYARNPRSRCYFCKLEVYGAASAIAKSEGYAWVVDGTNASDTQRDDRPGMTAASELHVRSPLAEAGITKEQLRSLARAIGVAGWDRPASACLASRIPFGDLITAERLRRVEAAELMDLRSHSSAVRARLVELGFESWSPAAYAGTGAGDSPNAYG